MTTPEGPAWRNRITGYGEEEPGQLLAHPNNARIHPLSQQRVLSDVLREVGLVQTIVVNKRTGCVLDGHLRAQMAISDGVERVPVTYVDLDEEEEALIVSTFDGIGNLAAYDRALVAETVPLARARVAPGGALDQWLQDLAGRAQRAIERAEQAEEAAEQQDAAAAAPAPQPEVEEQQPEVPAEAPPAEDRPSGLVEVVSLWYSPGDFAAFHESVAALGQAYGMTSTAAIVLRVVTEAHATLLAEPSDAPAG